MISGISVELPLLMWLLTQIPFGPLHGASNLRHRLDRYGEQAIQSYKEYFTSKQTSPSRTTSLFAKFLDREKNSELSDKTIVEEASNLIVAGSDTTAVTLTYLVWAVLDPRNARVREKLMMELAPLPLDLNSTEIGALPYLNGVLQEALRLYGAAPGSLPRAVPSGGVKLGAFFLPAGTTISTQAFTLHRNPEIFEEPLRSAVDFLRRIVMLTFEDSYLNAGTSPPVI